MRGSGIRATYYAIDGGATQTYGEPFTADLSTGVHTITYWSVDLAGNEEATGRPTPSRSRSTRSRRSITADAHPRGQLVRLEQHRRQGRLQLHGRRLRDPE